MGLFLFHNSGLIHIHIHRLRLVEILTAERKLLMRSSKCLGDEVRCSPIQAMCKSTKTNFS